MILTNVHPKLPMRGIEITKQFYEKHLAFDVIAQYPDYLILQRDHVQIHFFKFDDLNPSENYGQVYIRTDDIHALYRSFIDNGVAIHPNGHLEEKPWNQIEFSILDPDNNLLTFGQGI